MTLGIESCVVEGRPGELVDGGAVTDGELEVGGGVVLLQEAPRVVVVLEIDSQVVAALHLALI